MDPAVIPREQAHRRFMSIGDRGSVLLSLDQR